jgi:hypothetical protein
LPGVPRIPFVIVVLQMPYTNPRSTVQFSVSLNPGVPWGWNNVQEETIIKCSRPETDLQEQQDSTSESDLVSALSEALQFEVASEDDILENKANIPVHENIACTAEGILEDIMTGRVQGTSLGQRFPNCGPRTTGGPRVLPLWSSCIEH